MKVDSTKTVLVVLGYYTVHCLFCGMKTVVKERYFKIVGTQDACIVGVVSVKHFFDGNDVFFTKFGSDVEGGVELLLFFSGEGGMCG